MANGKGVYLYANGNRYEGMYLNDKKHGDGILNKHIGTFYFHNGAKYVGEWKDNKMHGKGIIFYYK